MQLTYEDKVKLIKKYAIKNSNLIKYEAEFGAKARRRCFYEGWSLGCKWKCSFNYYWFLFGEFNYQYYCLFKAGWSRKNYIFDLKIIVELFSINIDTIKNIIENACDLISFEAGVNKESFNYFYILENNFPDLYDPIKIQSEIKYKLTIYLDQLQLINLPLDRLTSILSGMFSKFSFEKFCTDLLQLLTVNQYKIILWSIHVRNNRNGRLIEETHLLQTHFLNMKNYVSPRRYDPYDSVFIEIIYDLKEDYSINYRKEAFIHYDLGLEETARTPAQFSIIQKKLNRQKIKRSIRYLNLFDSELSKNNPAYKTRYNFINSLSYDTMIFIVKEHIKKHINVPLSTATYYNPIQKQFKTVFEFYNYGCYTDNQKAFIKAFFIDREEDMEYSLGAGYGTNVWTIATETTACGYHSRCISEYIKIKPIQFNRYITRKKPLFYNVYDGDYYYRESNVGLINTDSKHLELLYDARIVSFIGEASDNLLCSYLSSITDCLYVKELSDLLRNKITKWNLTKGFISYLNENSKEECDK